MHLGFTAPTFYPQPTNIKHRREERGSKSFCIKRLLFFLALSLLEVALQDYRIRHQLKASEPKIKCLTCRYISNQMFETLVPCTLLRSLSFLATFLSTFLYPRFVTGRTPPLFSRRHHIFLCLLFVVCRMLFVVSCVLFFCLLFSGYFLFYWRTQQLYMTVDAICLFIVCHHLLVGCESISSDPNASILYL